MGTKTEVTFHITKFVICMMAVIVCILSMVSGCTKKSQYVPSTISVQEYDSSSHTSVTIQFINTYRPQNSPPYVELRTVEDVTAYKQEVEFLLNRLDEAEQRMNVHEPEMVEVEVIDD